MLMDVLGVILILGGILVVANILVAGRHKPAPASPDLAIVPDPPADEPVLRETHDRRTARAGVPTQRRRKQPE